MALVVETHQNTGGSGGNSSLGGVRRSGVDHVMDLFITKLSLCSVMKKETTFASFSGCCLHYGGLNQHYRLLRSTWIMNITPKSKSNHIMLRVSWSVSLLLLHGRQCMGNTQQLLSIHVNIIICRSSFESPLVSWHVMICLNQKVMDGRTCQRDL